LGNAQAFALNMNRIDRLMGIITQLQSKKHLTIPQISEQFSISERTVFRDLKAIGEIGVPVFFEPDKGYSVGKGFFLPPISLNVEEANALSLAEPLIVRFADKSIQQHFGSALMKIKMVMGRSQREKMEITQSSAAHFVPDHYAHLMPSTDYLTPLQNAIINQNIVRLEYLNQTDFHSIREVEPIGLTFYSLNWHLIAWCHSKNAYRDFRTSRIQNLNVTLRPFRKKDHIGLNEYLQQIQKEILAHPAHPLT
jgi:predicted DNA-binding transcriptional regulator YafY